jgi:hypothetical protein
MLFYAQHGKGMHLADVSDTRLGLDQTMSVQSTTEQCKICIVKWCQVILYNVSQITVGYHQMLWNDGSWFILIL